MNHESVQKYYGEVLQSSADLQTNACCTPAQMPDYLKAVLAKVHSEVQAKYYGCGLIAPLGLVGAKILDLGSGSGRDVYTLAGLVGETGHVVGVDMTKAQLDVARSYEDFHAEAFGYAKPNTTFHNGLIEQLDDLPLVPASFDIIVSNCVLNLATDKAAVLRGAYNLLKPGGEMYFSDVYSDRRVPLALQKDEVLYGECLSGALYWNDFENMAKQAGFADPRLVEDRPLTIENPKVSAKLGPISFTSTTYRLFKLDGLEPACEDYGQAVVYKGTMPQAPHGFELDTHHRFATGKVSPVSGNTWRMLKETRFAPHFEFLGTGENHFGPFEDHGQTLPFDEIAPQATVPETSGGCC